MDPRELHIVKLSDTEILSLQQLIMQPGFPVLKRLLMAEADRATALAIGCKDPDGERRLMLLQDAQSTHQVVGNLLRILQAYDQMQDLRADDIDEAILDPLSVLSYPQ